MSSPLNAMPHVIADPPALSPAGIARVVAIVGRCLAHLDARLDPPPDAPTRLLDATAGHGGLVLALIGATRPPPGEPPLIFVDAFGATSRARKTLVARVGVGQLSPDDVRDHFGPPRYALAIVVAPVPEARPHDVSTLVAHVWACHVLADGQLIAIVPEAAISRNDWPARALRDLLAESSDAPDGEPLPGGYTDAARTPGRIVVLHRRTPSHT